VAVQDAIGPAARRKSKWGDEAARLKIGLYQRMRRDADAETLLAIADEVIG